MIIFTPNTIIKSGDINLNFAGLKDGTDIDDGAINQVKISNPYKFYAYITSAFTATGKVNLNAELFDTNNDFDTSTYRYTAPVDGFYQFNFRVGFDVTTGIGYYAYITKNGSSASGIRGNSHISAYTNGSPWGGSVGAGILQLTAGDYIELYITGNSASGDNAGPPYTYLSGYLVSTT